MNRRLSIIRSVLAFWLVLAVGSGSFLTSAQPISAAQLGPRAWLAAGMQLFSGLQPLFSAVARPQALEYGNDGRLTVLLLGSDTRGGGISRTDTIMIMSLKGKQISAASIPRDAARIPNLLTASPSDTFKGRVNTIARQVGLPAFTTQVARMLNIEIDYYALVSFVAFDSLVNVVDPINVNIAKPIKDKRYWDDSTSRGIYFGAASNYQLFSMAASPACNGKGLKFKKPPLATWCHRALVYVRTRKGGSDFQRAARQQNFVGAAIRTVSSGDVGSLVSVANGQAAGGALMTNIPFNSSAFSLYSALDGAYLAHQVVFRPKKYSKHIPGTTAYLLNLTAIRAWTAAYMR